MEFPVSLPRNSVGVKIPVPPRTPLPLRDIPSWTKLPYDTKYPLPMFPKEITLSREDLGHSLYPTFPFKDFDLSLSSTPFTKTPGYSPLHDPHLRGFFQSSARYKALVRKGLVTEDGRVKAGLREYNQYRMYLYHLWVSQVNQLKELQMAEEKKRIESLIRAHECGDALFRDIVRKYDRIKVEDVLDEIASRLFETDERQEELDTRSPVMESFVRWRLYQEKLKKSFKQSYPDVKRWLNEQSKHYKLLMEKELNDLTSREKKMESRWAKIYSSSLARLHRETRLRQQEEQKRLISSEQRQDKAKSRWSKIDKEIKSKRKKERLNSSPESAVDAAPLRKRSATGSKAFEDGEIQLEKISGSKQTRKRHGANIENDQISAPKEIVNLASSETEILHNEDVTDFHSLKKIHKLENITTAHPTPTVSPESHKELKKLLNVPTTDEKPEDLVGYESPTVVIGKKESDDDLKIKANKSKEKYLNAPRFEFSKIKSCNNLDKTYSLATEIVHHEKSKVYKGMELNNKDATDFQSQAKIKYAPKEIIPIQLTPSSESHYDLKTLSKVPTTLEKPEDLVGYEPSRVTCKESADKLKTKAHKPKEKYLPTPPIEFSKIKSCNDLDKINSAKKELEDTSVDEDRQLESKLSLLKAGSCSAITDNKHQLLNYLYGLPQRPESENIMLHLTSDLKKNEPDRKAKVQKNLIKMYNISEYGKERESKPDSINIKETSPALGDRDVWERLDLSLNEKKRQHLKVLGLENYQLMTRRQEKLYREMLEFQSELLPSNMQVPKDTIEAAVAKTCSTGEKSINQYQQTSCSKIEATNNDIMEDNVRNAWSKILERDFKQDPYKIMKSEFDHPLSNSLRQNMKVLSAERNNILFARKIFRKKINIKENKPNRSTEDTDNYGFWKACELPKDKKDRDDYRAIKTKTPDLKYCDRFLAKKILKKKMQDAEKQSSSSTIKDGSQSELNIIGQTFKIRNNDFPQTLTNDYNDSKKDPISKASDLFMEKNDKDDSHPEKIVTKNLINKEALKLENQLKPASHLSSSSRIPDSRHEEKVFKKTVKQQTASLDSWDKSDDFLQEGPLSHETKLIHASNKIFRDAFQRNLISKEKITEILEATEQNNENSHLSDLEKSDSNSNDEISDKIKSIRNELEENATQKQLYTCNKRKQNESLKQTTNEIIDSTTDKFNENLNSSQLIDNKLDKRQTGFNQMGEFMKELSDSNENPENQLEPINPTQSITENNTCEKEKSHLLGENKNYIQVKNEKLRDNIEDELKINNLKTSGSEKTKDMAVLNDSKQYKTSSQSSASEMIDDKPVIAGPEMLNEKTEGTKTVTPKDGSSTEANIDDNDDKISSHKCLDSLLDISLYLSTEDLESTLNSRIENVNIHNKAEILNDAHSSQSFPKTEEFNEVSQQSENLIKHLKDIEVEEKEFPGKTHELSVKESNITLGEKNNILIKILPKKDENKVTVQLNDKRETLEQEDKSLENNIVTLRQEEEPSENNIETSHQEKESKNKIKTLQHKKEESENNLETLQQKKALENNMKTMHQEKEELENNIETLQQKKESSENNIETLQQKKESSENNTKTMHQEKEELENIETLQLEKEELENNMETMHQEKEESDNTKKTMNEDKEESENNIETLQQEKEALENNIETVYQEKEESENTTKLQPEKEVPENNIEIMHQEKEEPENNIEGITKNKILENVINVKMEETSNDINYIHERKNKNVAESKKEEETVEKIKTESNQEQQTDSVAADIDPFGLIDNPYYLFTLDSSKEINKEKPNSYKSEKDKTNALVQTSDIVSMSASDTSDKVLYFDPTTLQNCYQFQNINLNRKETLAIRSLRDVDEIQIFSTTDNTNDHNQIIPFQRKNTKTSSTMLPEKCLISSPRINDINNIQCDYMEKTLKQPEIMPLSNYRTVAKYHDFDPSKKDNLALNLNNKFSNPFFTSNNENDILKIVESFRRHTSITQLVNQSNSEERIPHTNQQMHRSDFYDDNFCNAVPVFPENVEKQCVEVLDVKRLHQTRQNLNRMLSITFPAKLLPGTVEESPEKTQRQICHKSDLKVEAIEVFDNKTFNLPVIKVLDSKAYEFRNKWQWRNKKSTECDNLKMRRTEPVFIQTVDDTKKQATSDNLGGHLQLQICPQRFDNIILQPIQIEEIDEYVKSIKADCQTEKEKKKQQLENITSKPKPFSQFITKDNLYLNEFSMGSIKKCENVPEKTLQPDINRETELKLIDITENKSELNIFLPTITVKDITIKQSLSKAHRSDSAIGKNVFRKVLKPFWKQNSNTSNQDFKQLLKTKDIVITHDIETDSDQLVTENKNDFEEAEKKLNQDKKYLTQYKTEITPEDIKYTSDLIPAYESENSLNCSENILKARRNNAKIMKCLEKYLETSEEILKLDS